MNNPEPFARTPTVVRVHGTFAGTDYQNKSKGRKPSWHERHSEFCNWLNSDCPHAASLELDNDFDWGGDNFESARIKAAEKLLNHLHGFEKIGQPYHIIAHSHGGSVVWTALSLAETGRWRKKMDPPPSKAAPALARLLSWATVGTPFIYAKRSPKGEIMAFVFQVGVLIMIGMLGKWGIEQFVPDASLWGESQITWQAASLVIWVFLVLVLIMVTIVQVPVLIHASLTANKRAGRASNEYMRRWFDIQSRQDEAVKGLQHSVSFNAEFMSRTIHRDVPYLWPFASRMRKLLFLPTRLFFNYLAVPVGNRYIRGKVRRKAIGDDEPIYRVQSIQESPLGEKFSKLYIDKSLDQELIDKANDALKAYVPKMREALAAGVTTAGNADLGVSFDIAAGEFSGNELVHTSYFESEGVRKLLLTDMALVQEKYFSKESNAWNESDADSERQWVKKFHQKVEDHLSAKESKISWHLPELLIAILLILGCIAYVYWMLGYIGTL